ncbi:MAG: dihydropteroate synthase [Nitrospiria bacterium]
MARSTQIMGILNVTPDSFWERSRAATVDAALDVARAMELAGADWIDVGGESTGPDSSDVSLEEEVRRVLPVVTALVAHCTVPVSVDTTKAEVARRALLAGARMINDVSALRGDEDMAGVMALSGVPVVLMYAKDPTPRTSRRDVIYDDVLDTIGEFLRERIAYALDKGIPRNRILIDPGMGWFVGADPKYSYEILHGLERVRSLGYPVVIGPSRKSFLGSGGDRAPRLAADRLMPTAAAVAMAAWLGADIIRVHDVEAMVQVVDTIESIKHPERAAKART